MPWASNREPIRVAVAATAPAQRPDTTGLAATTMTLADVDGDGILDLVLCNAGCVVAVGRGDGSFELRSTLGAGSGTPALAIGDLDAVLAFLRDAGLTVDGVAGARTAVQGHGPAEKISRAFDVPLGTYELPRALSPLARRAIAAERNPTIPASLASVIRGVAGLNTLPAARRFPPIFAPPRSKVPRRGAAAAGDEVFAIG